MELIYVTKSGEEKRVEVDRFTNQLVVEKGAPGEVIRYRSFFLPDEACIDYYISEWSTIEPEFLPDGTDAGGEGFIWD